MSNIKETSWPAKREMVIVTVRDIAATKHMSLRLGEVDYLLTDFRELPTAARKVQDNLRVSTGFRFRF